MPRSCRRRRAGVLLLPGPRPYQDYEHPGRVVLVGAAPGPVPAAGRSVRAGDRRPPAGVPAQPRGLRAARLSGGFDEPTRFRRAPRARPRPPRGVRRRWRGRRHAAQRGVGAAGRRAAGRRAVVHGRHRRATRSFPRVAGVHVAAAPVMPLLVFDPSGRRSLASFIATEAIGRRGCRDLLFAISGDGYRSLSPPSCARLATSGSRMREYHVSPACCGRRSRRTRR